MKTLLKIFATFFCVVIFIPSMLTSCSDVDGDGMGNAIWNGSTNPQNTGFRNPVWEPSLEAGTVLKGASMYVAISATTEWASGLTYYCPALTSNDLMNWSKASADAFTGTTFPAWSAGRVNSLSADFCRTYSGSNKYWMFYTLEGEDGIGYANASSPQGLYNDGGKVELVNNPVGVKNPFFFVQGKNFYLCYTTSDGTYLQKVSLSTKNGVTMGKNLPVKIAEADFTDIAIMARSASDFYIFGVNDGGIRYARASSAEGPYADKAGKSLLEGGNGETLITPSDNYPTVANPMRAFANSEATHFYLAYNAIQKGKETMASGYARMPMLIQPLEMDEEGWVKGTYQPQAGWVSPRFE